MFYRFFQRIELNNSFGHFNFVGDLWWIFGRVARNRAAQIAEIRRRREDA
jgi:hypothetical protein